MDTTAPEKIPFLRDPAKLAILYQILTLLGVGLLSYYLVHNTLANLERQSISTGFGFFNKEAAFEIGEKLIQYSAADSYSSCSLCRFSEYPACLFYRHRPDHHHRNHPGHRQAVLELAARQTFGHLY